MFQENCSLDFNSFQLSPQAAEWLIPECNGYISTGYYMLQSHKAVQYLLYNRIVWNKCCKCIYLLRNNPGNILLLWIYSCPLLSWSICTDQTGMVPICLELCPPLAPHTLHNTYSNSYYESTGILSLTQGMTWFAYLFSVKGIIVRFITT